MAIESKGNRLYVTSPERTTWLSWTKATLAVLATWPIKEAEQNAPLAFDEPGKRLFIIARKPGTLIVLNADTGASVASFKAPERCDQVIWDAANRRIYALAAKATSACFNKRIPTTTWSLHASGRRRAPRREFWCPN